MPPIPPVVAALLAELYPRPRPPQRHHLAARLRAAALDCPAVRRMDPVSALTGDMDNPAVEGLVVLPCLQVYGDRPGQQTLAAWVWDV